MTNRHGTIIAFVLATTAMLVSDAGGQPPPVENARRSKLIRAIKSDDSFAISRAVEELAELNGDDKATVDTLLKIITERVKQPALTYSSVRFVVAIGEMRGTVVAALITALRTTNGVPKERLLWALARMGHRASAAQLVLREQLASPETARPTKVRLRVALACIGGDSVDLRAKILHDLRDPDARDYTARMLALAKKQTWCTPAMVEELVALLEAFCRDSSAPTPSRMQEAHSALLAVPNMGQVSHRVVARMENIQRKLLAQDNVLAITATLVVARLDPSRTGPAVRRLDGALESMAGHTATGLIWDDAYLLVDDAVSERLAGMVTDRDPKVAGAAALLLKSAGLAARSAFVKILHIARGDAPRSARMRAAQVLANITPFDKLQELARAAKQEKSATLRAALQAAVEEILTLKEDKGR